MHVRGHTEQLQCASERKRNTAVVLCVVCLLPSREDLVLSSSSLKMGIIRVIEIVVRTETTTPRGLSAFKLRYAIN